MLRETMRVLAPAGYEYRWFHRRNDGDWDFFPFGAMARGYRVNAQQREAAADFLRRLYRSPIVVLGLGLAAAVFGFAFDSGDWLYLVLVPAIMLVMYLYLVWRIRRLMWGLPRTDRRLSWSEARAMHESREPPGMS